MAAGSLLALLDDIATILDDVALLSKVAAKKTAGVLGDDLALNAQQVSGVSADRELPVVWAVAKGSFVNKLILVPAALAISAFVPALVIPLLMVGGAYLCYEGFEKIVHRREPRHLPEDLSANLVELEKDRIRGAIRTDFILSAEIVVITLGTVAEAEFMTRVAVVSGIAILMTVGVYGLVAGIVKIDDAGLHLCRKDNAAARRLGAAILRVAPWLMRGLSVAGTAAMFLVGGGILLHGIPALHDWNESASWLAVGAAGAAAGVAAGALALAAVKLVQAMIRRWDRSRA